ncbi:MAG TPA: biotin/lipoyl-binding protein [Candidatus Omnitrophota bacterium]|nr:biotin/lipoyl-binding protein [Candidatus Omnitrophota bacterium]HPD83933.1 biotin/lipoyl-binding protein [Candidatus Omnitrophota bacterium]HRZ02790.1 biotin/lipoyl-binding protein [Candidatus Omnitrophota bacterium]
MTVSVKMPDLGEGISKATVASWLVKVGDRVNEGDDLVELVTDKASFNVPAAVTGIVRQILVQEGEEITIGGDLAVIE